MVQVVEEQDLEPAIEQVQEIIGHPMTSACQFYTLYYLVEVEDVDELGFELMRKSTELRDAFYNYSIYATLSESTHVREHFMWDGFRLNGITNRNSSKINRRGNMTEDEMEQRVQEKIDAKRYLEDAIRSEADGWPHDILKRIMIMKRRLPERPKRRESEYGWAQRYEKSLNCWTQDEGWFEAMEILFGTDWKGKYSGGSTSDNYGWNPSYGGSGWERVVNTATLKDEMGKQTYVDLMWSVEHNNGRFIDKVKMDVSEERERYNRAVEKITSDEPVTPKAGGGTDSVYFYDKLIPEILTAAREENLRLAFEVANDTIDEVSLRRYRTLIPDTELGEEPLPSMMG